MQQSNAVTSASSAVTEIARNIEAMEQMVEQQVRSVSEASSSVEEMLGNISSVAKVVEAMAAFKVL